MDWLELFLVAVGVSMDAFAVALGSGLGMKKLNYRHAIIIAAFFGGFQAAMPLIGWVSGRQFAEYITGFDHWVAFVLLAFIGGKIILESLRDNDEAPAYNNHIDFKRLFILSVATSIDALAVGIALALLKVSILPAIALIGTTTFLISLLGVVLGNRFGIEYKSRAELVGGFVLVLIGMRILLDHLNVI